MIMKSILFRFILLAFCMVFSIPEYAHAGSFIKINNVDTMSDYPTVKVRISTRNLDKTFISGLAEDNIHVFEDGYMVKHIRIKNLQDCPEQLHLVFSIDSSKSLSEDTLKKFKDSAKNIISTSGPHDRIALLRFNNEVIMMNNFTNNREELFKNLYRISRHGTKTLLLNSIYDSLDLLSKEDGSRKGVIVFTDGKDEGSSITSEDIIRFSRDLKIPVYFICLNSSKKLQVLARIAKLTGGKIITSDSMNDFTGMYKTLLYLIKGQYEILFPTMIQPDGQKHYIEVRLRYGSLRDRDINEVNFHREYFSFSQKSFSGILMAVLVILIIIILIWALVLIIQKKPFAQWHMRKKRDETFSGYDETEKAVPDRNFSSPVSIDDLEDVHEEKTRSKHDPEYAYAKAWLVEKDGPEVGKKFPIFWEEVTLGRNEENTIVMKDRSVSPKHAKIKKFRDTYYLFDLVSDNGTFINGKKLLRPKPLYDWDEIQMGRSILVFRGSKIG